MIRPRLLPCVTLACALAVPNLYAQPADEPMPDAPAAEVPAGKAPAGRAPAGRAPAGRVPAAKAPAAKAAPADDTAAMPETDDAAAEPAGQDAAAAPADDAAAPPADAAAQPPADGAAATAPAAAAPESSTLPEMVEDYWHYASITRYDLAAASAQRVLNSGAKPAEIRDAFEEVARRRRGDVDEMLLRWQQVDPLRDVTVQIIKVLNAGRSERVLDQAFIDQQIKRLATGERGFQNAMHLLQQSGQYAVPRMIDYLRDPQQQELHNPIRRALVQMRRSALSPLVAATDSKDPAVLVPVIKALGDIGYPDAIPYIVKAGTEPDVQRGVRNAADAALGALKHNARNANVADLFAEQGEKYYYGTSAIAADQRAETSPVWQWSEQRGLGMQAVPSAIFNEVMAMKAAETALQIGNGSADAASLWLAANNKREAELPQGATDPARGDRSPAHYYNVSLGVDRLNNVLARALRDRNTAVALKAVRSLQGVVGQSNMFPGNTQGGTPLTDALRFPDRTVRFEAAMAIAASLPQQPFNDQQRVVPLLAEAVSQSGRPNLLIVVKNEAERSRLAGELKNYGSAGGVGATGALAEERSLPSVDAILVAADVPDEEIDILVAESRRNPRLERTPKVIMRNHGGGKWPNEALRDATISVVRAAQAEQLAAAIEQARGKAGGLPMDEAVASDFALRAATLLSRLAISRGQVLDLSPALTTLLGSLSDPRPEVAKAVGETVALIESPQVQPALLDRAQDAQTAEEVRASLYRSLATSAKFFGRQLNEQQVATLRQTVAGEPSQDVRSAAAEALGALNAPVENVAQLITEGPRPAAGGDQPAQPEQPPAQTEPAPADAAPADAAPKPDAAAEPQ